MKKVQRITAAAGALALILAAGISVAAVQTGEPSTEKEEVIYASLDGSGLTEGIYAVNIFGKGDIVDYGDYSNVKVMNTEDEISVEGDKITLSTGADRLYYQGDLKSKELPWNIGFTYTLDGKKLTPEQLAGKDGNLKIEMNFSQNTAVDSCFYDKYALQITMALNTEKCSNISADGATVANAGKNKQLSYILLPGRDHHLTVTAKVKDFEMDAVSINGIRLGLDIDVDTGSISGKINEIRSAAEQINSGAQALAEGIDSLDEGTRSLDANAAQLAAGTSALADGIDMFNDGIKRAAAGLEKLQEGTSELSSGSDKINGILKEIDSSLSAVSVSADEVKKLVEASGAINGKIGELAEGTSKLSDGVGSSVYESSMKQGGLDVESLVSGNASSASALSSDVAVIDGMISYLQSERAKLEAAGYGDVVSDYLDKLNALKVDIGTASGQLSADNTAIGGAESYMDGLHGKTEELNQSVSKLMDSYEEFNLQIGKLASELGILIGQMNTLSEAIHELSSNYAVFNGKMGECAEGVAELNGGFSESAQYMVLLALNSRELAGYMDALSKGTSGLSGYMGDLNAGSDKLALGTAEFAGALGGADAEIDEAVNSMISELTGGSAPVRSFVSSKNTKVDSVQFVITTKPVKTAD